MIKCESVLIIGFVWPEPQSSAAGARMLQLINLFNEQNWQITFASAAGDSDYMTDLSALNVATVNISLNSDAFDDIVKKLNPSIVLFDRFMTEEQFGWRVATQCPDAMRILDSEDLHCLRQTRHAAFKKGRDFELRELLSADITKREIASMLRCDLTLIISEFEMEILTKLLNVDKELIFYLPLFAKPSADNPTYEERCDFVFFGNFHHEPNRDAVLYLKHDIWTGIHAKVPQASLHIYGAYPQQRDLQLHKPMDNFFVHGRAADAPEVVKKSRVVLAPLRFGAGIKGKLLEAMQCETPSVTTSIGAEGMNGNLSWNGIIADDTEEFVNAAVGLYNDKVLWNTSSQNGLEIINQRFLKSSFADNVISRIIKIQQNLNEHRINNFTGAMLGFHTMRSTEYLSRWIMEKNTKNPA